MRLHAPLLASSLALSLLVCTSGSASAQGMATEPVTETPAPPDAPLIAPPPPAPVVVSTPVAVPPLPPRDPGELNGAQRPLLSFGTDAYYVKPILAIAGGIQSENFLESLNKNKESRVITVAITRFGFEGRLGPYVSFRSEFERNIGRHGTGIWEGTASFSVRDQFIRLSRWGVTLDGGIILDEASIDFFSLHTGDLLLADRYTRDPLLYSGFNRGQGLKASYERWGLRAGLSYTEANPLSTSTSFQVGGAFGGGSRLFERPLGNFRIGQPDDDLHFRILSPSLMFTREYLELKAMAQFFWVNYQTNSQMDPAITGMTLKGNARGYLRIRGRFPVTISPFANFSYIRNDVLNNASGYSDQLLATSYSAITASGGLDFLAFGRSGIGGSVAVVRDNAPGFIPPMGMAAAMEPVTTTTQLYINAGMTYWVTDYVAAAIRVASYRRMQDNQPDELDVSVFSTLRLIL